MNRLFTILCAPYAGARTRARMRVTHKNICSSVHTFTSGFVPAFSMNGVFRASVHKVNPGVQPAFSVNGYSRRLTGVLIYFERPGRFARHHP